MANTSKPVSKMTLADVLAYVDTNLAQISGAQQERILTAIDEIAEDHTEETLHGAYDAVKNALEGVGNVKAGMLEDGVANAEAERRDVAIRLAFRVAYEMGRNDGIVEHARLVLGK